MLLIWTIVNAALAAPVVLHRETDADAVRAAVVKSSGVPVSGLTITHFDAFRASLTPKWSGLGGIEACAAAATDTAALTALTKSAEGRLMYMELEDAGTALSTAAKGLRCLNTPVDASMAARIGFLHGVVSLELGDKAKAWEHFAAAARYQPDLVWDEQFPKTGEALLKAAKSELTSSTPVELSLVPTITAEGSLYVNGAQPSAPASTVALTPGEHLLQVQTSDGIVGYTATIEADSTPSVFIPETLAEDALAQVTTEEGRTELSRMVTMAFDSGTPVYVVHGEHLWRTASGIGSWENLRPGQMPGQQVAARAKLGPVAWLSAGVTTTVAIGTVGALLVGMNARKSAATSQDQMVAAAKTGAWDEVDTAWDNSVAANSRQTNGFVTASVGAALTITGVVITIPMFKVVR
jgi:hypothetical protein